MNVAEIKSTLVIFQRVFDVFDLGIFNRRIEIIQIAERSCRCRHTQIGGFGVTLDCLFNIDFYITVFIAKSETGKTLRFAFVCALRINVERFFILRAIAPSVAEKGICKNAVIDGFLIVNRRVFEIGVIGI